MRNCRFSFGALIGALAIALCVTGTAFCAPGDLDLTFGTAGQVLGPSGQAWGVAIQADGDIVLTGEDKDAGELLVRLKNDGSPDATFGTDGQVTNPPAGRGFSSVILPSDAGIVTAGATRTQFSLAKYLPNGSLDPKFGSNGLVLQTVLGGPFGIGTALASKSNGKYIVVGSDHSSGPNAPFELVLMRFTKKGILDKSFGTKGIVTTTFGNGFALGDALAIQSDNKIVVAGQTGESISCGQFVVARFLVNGKPDKSFGDSGVSIVNFGGSGQCESAAAVAIDANGQIVAAGSRSGSASKAFYLARLNQDDGSLDTSFGVGGKLELDVGQLDAHPHSMAIESKGSTDGDIIIAGYSDYLGGEAFAIGRVLPDGPADDTFGTDGIVSTQFPQSPATRFIDGARGVALQSDGKIVAGGEAFIRTTPFTPPKFATARYLDQ